MTRQQLIAAVVTCGGKAPRVRRIRSDCSDGPLFPTKHWSWFRGARDGGRYGHNVPRAWTPQDCSDSDVDLLAGVIRR